MVRQRVDLRPRRIATPRSSGGGSPTGCPTALSTRLPFTGEALAPGNAERLVKILLDPPVPIQDRRCETANALAGLIDPALQKKADGLVCRGVHHCATDSWRSQI